MDGNANADVDIMPKKTRSRMANDNIEAVFMAIIWSCLLAFCLSDTVILLALRRASCSIISERACVDEAKCQLVLNSFFFTREANGFVQTRRTILTQMSLSQ